MVKKNSYLLFLTLVLLGCNPIALLPNPARERMYKAYLDYYADWRIRELSKIQDYVGSTKETIRSIFGDPFNIITYPGGEFWNFYIYENGKKIGVRRFYFKEGRVYKVDVL